MEPAKPSLELLRSLTDEHVLRALMRQPRLTRAELATATGISKPTAGESVRRLVAAGLVADTGERTAGGRGRGRVGTYYALAAGVGVALAASIAPEGIVAECISAHGAVMSRSEQTITHPAQPAQVAAALRAAATQAIAAMSPADAVSAADAAGAGDAVSAADAAGAGDAVSAADAAGAADAARAVDQPHHQHPHPQKPHAPHAPHASQADASQPDASHADAADAVSKASAADAVGAASGPGGPAGPGGPVRLAVVSAADPVDRATGRMVHLPDSPFLLGDLDPVAVLAPLVAGLVLVDNDVNWAARAERAAATRPEREVATPDADTPEAGAMIEADLSAGAPGAGGLDDFAYLYLGEGLGCAVVSDGEVRRGHAGLAGEIAHLLTVGPDGQAVSLIDVFGQLGLRQSDATAIDTARLLAATMGPEPQAAAVRQAVARAVAGAIAAVVALSDPAQVILGGPWGHHPDLTAAIAGAVASLPRPVPVRAATLTTDPSLAGARTDALARLRAAIITRAQSAPALM